jgi:hypothetical protein
MNKGVYAVKQIKDVLLAVTMMPFIVISSLLCVVLVVIQELMYMISNWDFRVINPFSNQWKEASFGAGCLKQTVLNFIRFNVTLLKLPKGCYVDPHFDQPYRSNRYFLNSKYRCIKIYFTITNSEGGDFICKNAYVNNSFVCIYEPDMHRHSFTTVTRGTKRILSLTVLF